MGLMEYVETITGRIDANKVEKRASAAQRDQINRWNAGGRVYLPEAPAGWTRRAFTDGDNSAITLPPGTMATAGSTAGAALVVAKNSREAADQTKAIANRAWVYERDNETVYVEVRLKEKSSDNSLVGLVAKTMDGVA